MSDSSDSQLLEKIAELEAQIAELKNKPSSSENKILYNKLYYEANKAKIRARAKAYDNTEAGKAKKAIRNKKYREGDAAETIKAKKREYYEKTKEEQKEKRSVKVECECGLEVMLRNKSRHDQSKTHLAIMKNKEKKCEECIEPEEPEKIKIKVSKKKSNV